MYRDAAGLEDILIRNDGKTLRVWIRGLEFEGSDFDLLEPVDGACELTPEFERRKPDMGYRGEFPPLNMYFQLN